MSVWSLHETVQLMLRHLLPSFIFDDYYPQRDISRSWWGLFRCPQCEKSFSYPWWYLQPISASLALRSPTPKEQSFEEPSFKDLKVSWEHFWVWVPHSTRCTIQFSSLILLLKREHSCFHEFRFNIIGLNQFNCRKTAEKVTIFVSLTSYVHCSLKWQLRILLWTNSTAHVTLETGYKNRDECGFSLTFRLNI